MKNAFVVFAVGLAALMSASMCQATSGIVYSDFTSWSAAVGGFYQFQDFEGYVDLQNLDGIDVLPGVNFTSNMPNVVAWKPVPSADVNLFAYGGSVRDTGNAYYDININLPYCAVAFDVEAWDPESGPAVAEIFFSDLTSVSLDYYQTGPTEQTPVFFGIVVDTAITRIRWHEGLENTTGYNEEVAFDNLAVSRTCIPEPAMISTLGVLFLLGAGRGLKRKA